MSETTNKPDRSMHSLLILFFIAKYVCVVKKASLYKLERRFSKYKMRNNTFSSEFYIFKDDACRLSGIIQADSSTLNYSFTY